MVHIAYLSYVVRHKWWVFVAGMKLRRYGLAWRLFIHDWSKFLPDEWIPYASFFYGDYYPWETAKHIGLDWEYSQEGVSSAFDLAWLIHQRRNKHHWQFWVLLQDDGDLKLIDMPDTYAWEMVCDWMGAGRAITGKWEVKLWYEQNKTTMKLSHRTRMVVEDILAKHVQ